METMKFHITKRIYLRTILFLHLSGPNEQIYTLNELPNVFNVGLTTPLDTSLPDFSPFIFKFSLIYLNIQMR